LLCRRARQRNVPKMDGVERTAEQPDVHAFGSAIAVSFLFCTSTCKLLWYGWPKSAPRRGSRAPHFSSCFATASLFVPSKLHCSSGCPSGQRSFGGISLTLRNSPTSPWTTRICLYAIEPPPSSHTPDCPCARSDFALWRGGAQYHPCAYPCSASFGHR